MQRSSGASSTGSRSRATVRRHDGTTFLTKPGRLMVEWDWSPDLDRLLATSYRYLLPVLDEP
ncbi:MAG: hypothetical protein WCO36_08675 [Actinomycetes bacterium]